MTGYTMHRKMSMISWASLIVLLLVICGYAVPDKDSQQGSTFFNKKDVIFSTKIISSGLRDPWDLAEGPGGRLWITESKSYKVLQIDTASGEQKVLLDLSQKRDFTASGPEQKEVPWPQGGLMGMALHPQLSGSKPYIYLAYVHRYLKGNRFQLKIERYTYNDTARTLEEPQTICDTIPASNDHNGGRLTIANIDGKPYLFYSVGDMGSGQFSNGGVPNQAQNLDSYEGKILRYALEPDGNSADENSWIPVDNPFNSNKPSAVWSTGHRNPQGLAAAVIGGKELLYSAEHGPYSDDEINLVEKGKNYGHPLVVGYADGNYNGLAASVSTNQSYPGKWHTTYPLITSEQTNANRLGKAYRDPVKSFYPTSNTKLKQLFADIQSDRKSEWKAWAPSGIAIYTGAAIPGWKNSILVATLKGGTLLRIKLDNKGRIASDVFEYEKGQVRYRDVEVSRDGATIYLITDSSSVTSNPSAANPKQANCRGCVIRLRYASAGAK